jgi:hypothetical protein
VVVLGFFLLIIPGLLLSLAPTAFLWGCIFAAAWWLCRTALTDGQAAVAALTLTAVFLVMVPWPSRLAGQKTLTASVLPNVTPSERVKPVGDIRLDSASPRWDNKNPPVNGHVRAFSRDNLCVALLFTPDVKSVTVNSSSDFTPEQHRNGAGGFATGARTYRLLPRAQCGGREIKVDLEGRVGLFGKTLEENRTIAAEWNLRLATEYCVVAEEAIHRFDMMLRSGAYEYPEKTKYRPSSWSLASTPAYVDYAEIRDGSGIVLLRRLISRVHVLAWPFAISPTGGIENFRFGWGRSRLSNDGEFAEAGLLEVLKGHSTLADPVAAIDLLPRIRSRLQQVVADRTIRPSDPAFETIEAYFAELAGRPLQEQDLALARALILDDRITSFRGLHHLQKAPAEQHRQIRQAIVQRLLTTSDAKALRRSEFSGFLEGSPAGVFSNLSDEEVRFLASPERRVAARGLVARLADVGSVAVPLVTDILRHHGAALAAVLASRENAPGRSAGIEMHSGMVDGARMALCRLGPAAASDLLVVEAMIADGTIPEYSLGSEWDLTLLRLGKPLESIRKPKNLSGTEAQYRRSMQEKLDRFNPDRSC